MATRARAAARDDNEAGAESAQNGEEAGGTTRSTRTRRAPARYQQDETDGEARPHKMRRHAKDGADEDVEDWSAATVVRCARATRRAFVWRQRSDGGHASHQPPLAAVCGRALASAAISPRASRLPPL